MPPPLLRDRVEFVFAALAERVSTNPRPPAPPPAEAPAPAQRLPVLLPRRQQEDHAAGHQDVPQRVRVVVVALRLGEDVQAHSDEGAQRSGQEVEDPALPGGWVAVSPADAPVHLLVVREEEQEKPSCKKELCEAEARKLLTPHRALSQTDTQINVKTNNQNKKKNTE